MIKYGLLKLSVILVLGYLLINSCYAQSVSGKELIENARDYDLKAVTLEGEVIGDIMCRGQYCWVNLNDGSAAIGVWLPKERAKIIKYKGSYKQTGDWLRVTGVFNRACQQHSGQLDIHADEIKKVKQGKTIPEKVSLNKRNLAIVLLGVLCIVWIFSRLKTS